MYEYKRFVSAVHAKRAKSFQYCKDVINIPWVTCKSVSGRYEFNSY